MFGETRARYFYINSPASSGKHFPSAEQCDWLLSSSCAAVLNFPDGTRTSKIKQRVLAQVTWRKTLINFIGIPIETRFLLFMFGSEFITFGLVILFTIDLWKFWRVWPNNQDFSFCLFDLVFTHIATEKSLALETGQGNLNHHYARENKEWVQSAGKHAESKSRLVENQSKHNMNVLHKSNYYTLTVHENKWQA